MFMGINNNFIHGIKKSHMFANTKNNCLLPLPQHPPPHTDTSDTSLPTLRLITILTNEATRYTVLFASNNYLYKYKL